MDGCFYVWMNGFIDGWIYLLIGWMDLFGDEFMYWCMDWFIDGWMDLFMYGFIHLWMGGFIDVWIDLLIDGWIY